MLSKFQKSQSAQTSVNLHVSIGKYWERLVVPLCTHPHAEQRKPKPIQTDTYPILIIPANTYPLGPIKYIQIHSNTYTVHINTYQYIPFFVLSRKRLHWKPST